MSNRHSDESAGGNATALSVRHNEENTGLSVLNLLDEKQLANAEVFLKKIISSQKSGITNVPDGLSILMRAQDLNLPFSACIEHIHVINGKTGIDIHIIKSLLSRAGVTWECTKDYAPQYQYTDGNTIYNETQLPEYCVKCRTAKEAEDNTNETTIGVYPVRFYADLKGNIYNEFQIDTNKCVIALNRIQAQKYAQEGKVPIMRIPAQPIDYVTEYEFTRYRIINGKERITRAKGRFSLVEATKADFFSKDTYKKYPRIMISHRAFTLGARDIASDALMGCMETSELLMVSDKDLDEIPFVETEEVN